MSRGHVVKRGRSWSIVVELAADPQTGKRRQRWHSGFRTRKDAERERVKLLAAIDSGAYVENTRQTVSEFVGDWLPAIEETLRPSTLHSYRRNLMLHVLPYIGTLPLSSADPGTLNGLYARLRREGRRDRPGGLSARSVRYVHTILHRSLRDAVRWGRLIRNPADAADPPRATASAAPEMRTWAAADLRRFLEAVSHDRLHAAFCLLATTGMRRGEALGMRWADLDLEAERAAIRQTVIAVEHTVVIGTPKTAKGRRVVALDAGTVAALRAHRGRQLEERLLMGTDGVTTASCSPRSPASRCTLNGSPGSLTGE